MPQSIIIKIIIHSINKYNFLQGQGKTFHSKVSLLPMENTHMQLYSLHLWKVVQMTMPRLKPIFKILFRETNLIFFTVPLSLQKRQIIIMFNSNKPGKYIIDLNRKAALLWAGPHNTNFFNSHRHSPSLSNMYSEDWISCLSINETPSSIWCRKYNPPSLSG